jgi:peptidoglycan/xylan/chitin deacetylase (PgdA/CDA1 family)
VAVDRLRLRRRALAFAALLAALAGVSLALLPALHSSKAHPVANAAPAPKPKPKPRPRPQPPLRRAHPSAEPVPILMYHVLGTAPPGAPFPSLFVPAAELRAQVDWLAANGYHAVTLEQLFAGWRGTRPLPPKPVVLTFDDGYLSDYTVALPALRRHGWPGVLDLTSKNLRPGDISPSQVRALVAAGWEIAAHTISHVDLTTLDAARLRQETAGSRAQLRQRFHVPVDFFCYPAGRYDARVVAAVKAAGFLGATTENPGLGRPDDAFTLARIRVVPGEGALGLERQLQQLGS